MNNLKQYKKHFGKEFIGNDYNTCMFYNSKAVTKMFQKINKLEEENKQLKERILQVLRYMDNSFISNIDGVDEEIWEIKEILKGDSNED